jgi:hypothetical protein
MNETRCAFEKAATVLEDELKNKKQEGVKTASGAEK